MSGQRFNATIPCFVRREGQSVWIQTLGLGRFNQHVHAGHENKAKQRLRDAIRRETKSLTATERMRFEMARGLQLTLHTTDLAVRAEGGGKRKFYGTYPMLSALRWTTPTRAERIMYHPYDQDAWFVVRDEVSATDQVKAYLQHRFAPLDDSTIEAMAVEKKRVKLAAVSLHLESKGLLDDVQKRLKDLKDPLAALLGAKQGGGGLKVLRDIGDNLSRKAADGVLDGGTPRGPLRKELDRLLSGKLKRSVLLVGRSGVGKTTAVKRWVMDLLDADDYPSHQNLDRCHQVWQVGGRRIIAGMSRVGEWEQRAVDLLADTKKSKSILYVDDIHTFARVGQSQQSERSLADFFRGPVARGDVTIVGELTAEGFEQLAAEAPGFADAFTIVQVAEPSANETLAMMIGAVRELELYSEGLTVDPDAYRTILSLCDSLYTHRAYPDKALALLRGAAGECVGQGDLVGGEYMAELATDDVIKHVSAQTGVPDVLLRSDTPLTLETVTRQLERYVMGQPVATRAAAELILTIKANLCAPGRPWSVMLFTGPTGTGKTELAKSIAAYLYSDDKRLIRFDMSELSGPDAPGRLIGHRYAPEGLLTERVREQPFSVVLLDEIEKAHPSVLNLFLQLFDEGKLTDAAGRVTDFTHTVIVMTSNLGSKRGAKVGFGDGANEVLLDIDRAVRRHFPPELFNRIDHVLPFSPLDDDVARRIAGKELARLFGRRGLVDRHIFASANRSLVEHVAAVGFDARDGARALKRFIEREVAAKLTEAIAGQASAELRRFQLYLRQGTPPKVALHIEALRETDAIVAEESAIASLEALDLVTLQAEIPTAIAFIDALLDRPALAELSATLREHLTDYNLGDRGGVDQIVNLEAMRGELAEMKRTLEVQQEVVAPDEAEVLERLHFSQLQTHEERRFLGARRVRLFAPSFRPRDRRLDRDELLSCFAELHFLERALTLAPDPRQHAVLVTLTRIGSPSSKRRFGAAREGLLTWLATAYATGRGELLAVSVDDGEQVLHGTSADQFAGALATLPSAQTVVLQIAGLCIYDVLSTEAGCHLRQALSTTPEIVRVDVLPVAAASGVERDADELSAAAKHLAVLDDAAHAFAEALERGDDPLPSNPRSLLPVIRRYRYDPDPGGRASECIIEDYATLQVEKRTVGHLRDGLARIWRRSLGRAGAPEQTANDRGDAHG